MPLQFLLKTTITVALVLLASGLAKRPGLLGGLAFFPALSLSLRAGWPVWTCFAVAALAAFAGMSATQAALTHFRSAG